MPWMNRPADANRKDKSTSTSSGSSSAGHSRRAMRWHRCPGHANHADPRFRGDAVVMATGGCGLIFGKARCRSSAPAGPPPAAIRPARNTAIPSSSRFIPPQSPGRTNAGSSANRPAARGDASGCPRSRAQVERHPPRDSTNASPRSNDITSWKNAIPNTGILSRATSPPGNLSGLPGRLWCRRRQHGLSRSPRHR